MKRGDTGPCVRAWQRLVGVPVAEVDGSFGPKTEAYAKIWQARRGLPITGVLGSMARAALKSGDFIKPFEGLRLQTYDDANGRTLLWIGSAWQHGDGTPCVGKPTIGWGRRLWPGETIQFCTRTQADAWFDNDVQARVNLVRTALGADATPVKVCAATCLAYNAGTGAMQDVAAAGWTEKAWEDYCHSLGKFNPGLLGRREEEYALFCDASDATD